MLKLCSVETGYKQSANFQRTLTSIIVMAESSDQALQFAQRHYPEAIAEGTDHRIIEASHEGLYSKQFHC